jgi:hypothetical protein
MKKKIKRPSKQRSTDLALALLIGLIGLVALYKLGVKPAAAGQPAPAAPLPTRGIADKDCCQQADLNGLAQPLDSGDEDIPASEYLNRLEARYRARGYVKLEYDPKNPARLRARVPASRKLYWRIEQAEKSLLGAHGTDANPLSNEVTSSPQTFLTVVRATGIGESHWAVYRFDETAAASLNMLFNRAGSAALSGADPAGFPLHPSLSRVLGFQQPGALGASAFAAYTSAQSPETLLQWYRGELARQGWQLDVPLTEQAGQAAPGMLCFVQEQRTCLLWICPAEGESQTSVIINVTQP